MYLKSVNIYCAAPHCRQIVRSDGINICEHVVLNHRHIRGETIRLCRRCSNRADVTRPLINPAGLWTMGERAQVEV